MREKIREREGKIVIDLAELEERIRRLAAEFPDRVTGCTYIIQEEDGPECHCIVGQAMNEMGLSLELLDHLDSFGQGIASHIEGVHAWDWVARVQKSQDNGNPWAQAVREADELMETMRSRYAT